MMIIIIITYEQQKYLFIVIFFPWKITLIKIVVFRKSRILIGILGRKRKRLYNKSIDGESGCFCYRVTL